MSCLSRPVPEIHYTSMLLGRSAANKPTNKSLTSKVGEPEICPCNADIMTAEHLLQHCRQHDAMRRDTWPDPTLLRDKLYGNLEELRRTAAFVRATGIFV